MSGGCREPSLSLRATDGNLAGPGPTGLDSAQLEWPCQQDTLFLLHWGSSRACRNRCPLSAQAWGWVSFLDAFRKQRIWVEISWFPRKACWHPHWPLSASIDWVSSSQHPLQMYKHLFGPSRVLLPSEEAGLCGARFINEFWTQVLQRAREHQRKQH